MDEATTILLIQWATSSHRNGKHRAVVVAKLIKKRQSELRDQVRRHWSENLEPLTNGTCRAKCPY